MSDLEINKPNCVGYAYYLLGIEPIIKYINPLPVPVDFWEKFREVSQEESTAVVVLLRLGAGGEMIQHMALLDPDDHSFVWEIKGIGDDPGRFPLSDLLELYSNAFWDNKRTVFVRRRDS